MKLSRCFAQAALALSIASLAAGCGGGNDKDAGGLTEFNVAPESITLTGTTTGCPTGGYAGRVFVNGGAGPYRVNNTNPAILAVSKTRLERPGDYFDVQVAGACFDGIPIVVIDALGRQSSVTITYQKDSGT